MSQRVLFLVSESLVSHAPESLVYQESMSFSFQASKNPVYHVIPTWPRLRLICFVRISFVLVVHVMSFCIRR